MTVLYENPLASPADLEGFRLEGDGATSYPLGRLRLESVRPADDGQDANVVLWCPEEFPPDITVEWDFWPIREPGLCILFFHAKGRHGEDLFELRPRTGPYEQYHHGDFDTYHVSYFRRRWPAERAFHTCNLRKSPGFHLVAQGADPLPPVVDARDAFYRIEVVKDGAHVSFAIDDLPLFAWADDESTGPRVREGRIGFRQMSPLVACYRNLEVHSL